MRIGIIGGGQLGRMLALAGHDLGIDCSTLDPAEHSPASQVAPAIVGAYDDRDALLALADGVDAVTYEFENVPAASTRFLEERGTPLYPPPRSLEVAQDRLEEKTLFTDVGLPVPTFAAVDDLASLRSAIDAIGLPAVLKTRRLGYDGKGQAVIRHEELADDAWRAVGEVPSILEALIGFDREVSVLGVRDRDGATAFWPVVENRHLDGLLRTTTAPAPGLTDALQRDAEGYGAAVMDRLGHVGVLAIELFEVGGHVLGNEFAPRVHNSGHWTIEGARTSQFENHLRAVTGLPIGDVGMDRVAGMVNLIGSMPDEAAILAVPEVHLHRYGKSPRPGRKIGHVTVLADTPDALRERMLQVTTQLADS
jgi:5-(carboxyamino)imidazole ribonucleotide synthase